MNELPIESRTVFRPKPGALWRGGLVAAALALAGCGSAPRDLGAIRAYYDYDFMTARERLRDDRRDDEQALLADMRLGMAALADGNAVEAERALGSAFDLLSTAGLNADRTTAAVVLHEGVRIWKGEPFEQALAYHEVAALYAVLGDWENARAAAANALFRLADFGGDRNADDYTPVETTFALGYLMQAIASEYAGTGGRDDLLDAALAIDPDLAPLVDTLRADDYDTLLIVEHGKGPTKVAHGRDGALAAFVAQDPAGGPLVARVDDVEAARVPAACDVAEMATDYRWRHLEGARVAKSIAGDLLVTSGVIVAHHGRNENALIGGLMLAAGLLAKAGARADTRYLEFVPRSIYLVPLRLGGRRDVTIAIAGDGGAALSLPALVPGTPGAPRAIYLRVHGADSPRPPWLRAGVTRYGNDHTGVRPGDYPWILGGADVSTPTRATLEAYQAGGHLRDMTLGDLTALYRAEGIAFGPSATGAFDRHILDGGGSLYTPLPDSMGYRRLMTGPHPPFAPRSELVRNAAREVRVQETLERDALRPTGTLDDWLAEDPE